MNINNKSRTISLSDTTLLITNAGGRCSYNYDKTYCNKVLSDGRVNLGERAHIIGVNGPRAEFQFNGNKNGYENLIWLCKDHHKIIDHPDNFEKFSPEVLREMKLRHEERIKTGRYPYYGTPQYIHDYSVLSCLFNFINIHRLYYCVASYPDIHLDFFDVSYMCNLFREDNPGDLPLRDPILKRVFERFEYCNNQLVFTLNQTDLLREDTNTLIYTWKYSYYTERIVFDYLVSVEHLVGLIEKRFPQILHQEVYDPFPEGI